MTGCAVAPDTRPEQRRLQGRRTAGMPSSSAQSGQLEGTDRGYGRRVDDLESSVDRIAAATGFSGVVRVDRGGRVDFAKAYGLAHRGWGIPNAVNTRFGIASGTKGLTALSIMSLIEEGRLDFDTTARSVLGEDLPRIDDGVTVEHLLSHRSGIGDYF